MRILSFKTVKQVKKVVIAVIGTTVLLIGVAMIVLPGPAFIVIPLGLGILATEFTWARKLLKKVKDKLPNVQKKKGKIKLFKKSNTPVGDFKYGYINR